MLLSAVSTEKLLECSEDSPVACLYLYPVRRDVYRRLDIY